MNSLTVLADTGFDLIVHKMSDGRYQVFFEKGYVKDGVALVGKWGVGRTVEAAARDYLEKINNEILVFGSGENRKEIMLIYRTIGGLNNEMD